MVFVDEGGSKHTRELDLEAPSIGDILGNVEVYLEALYSRHNWNLETMRVKGDKNGTPLRHSNGQADVSG